jgi:hypothetical protein
MRPDATTYRLLDGHGLLIAHGDELVRLRVGASVCRPVADEPYDDELPLAA